MQKIESRTRRRILSIQAHSIRSQSQSLSTWSYQSIRPHGVLPLTGESKPTLEGGRPRCRVNMRHKFRYKGWEPQPKCIHCGDPNPNYEKELKRYEETGR